MSNPTGLDALSSGEIFRKDFSAVLACRRDLAVIRPIRVPYLSGGYVAGTVMAQYTSGAASGQFPKYTNGGASGSDTAVCILFDEIVDDGTNATILARGIFSGVVFYNALPNVDSTAVINLSARTYTDASGVKLLQF